MKSEIIGGGTTAVCCRVNKDGAIGEKVLEQITAEGITVTIPNDFDHIIDTLLNG